MGSRVSDTGCARSGARRLIPPRKYRHLRAYGGTRMAAGIVLTGLGVATLSFGGNDAKTYGWTAFWLLLGGADVALGHGQMMIARSA